MKSDKELRPLILAAMAEQKLSVRKVEDMADTGFTGLYLYLHPPMIDGKRDENRSAVWRHLYAVCEALEVM